MRACGGLRDLVADFQALDFLFPIVHGFELFVTHNPLDTFLIGVTKIKRLAFPLVHYYFNCILFFVFL